jgi:iron complex outermembrane receptor protein
MAFLSGNHKLCLLNRISRLAYLYSSAGRICFKNLIPKTFICIILLSFTNFADADYKLDSNQLLDLSIEELLKIKVVNVSSVSRRTQKLTEVASAVFVITQEDIRRSGATSIPEALRMAPGVEVARISTDKWGVSIRGFNGFSANKVQVLIDGRSDYSPLFAGTLWAQQDTFMEDIDRIEIIRGPAASVWGTNAVNGIINIITKHASDTQGTLLTAGGGSFEQGFFGARYGGKINDETPFRIYAKGFTRDSTQSLSGANNLDQWHSTRAGFRVDHARGIDKFTLHGEFFYNFLGDTLNKTALDLPVITGDSRRANHEGGYLRFRWDRTLSERSSYWLQMAYDRNRYQLMPFSKYYAESIDIDFQHIFPLMNKHDITWGIHYRMNENKVFDSEVVTFSPRQKTNHFFSLFFRDDITLIPDRLRFTIGTRFDHNDYTGLEIQPNARLMWTPNEKNSLWMAVSRAVRTPSRSENDARVNLGFNYSEAQRALGIPFPIMPVVQGSKNFEAEKLLAYELGYRHQFSSRASLDIAGFVNDYSQLRDFSFGGLSLGTGLPQHLLLQLLPNNKASALTYGFEAAADWKPLDKWHLQSSYSYLQMHTYSVNKLFGDPISGAADKVSPQHQFSLRSNYDISDRLQLNLWLRYVSKIQHFNIPNYVTMDAKLSWTPLRNTEFFLVGQNLFQENHREFVSELIPSTPALIPRGVYVGAQWRF